ARVFLDRRLVARREREEADDEDERHDRVEDLDRHVVPHLHRQAGLALAAAVDDRGPEGQHPRDDADREEHRPRGDPQADHAIGVVRGADSPREVAVELLLRAARENDGDREADRDDGPTGQSRTLWAGVTHLEPLRTTTW